MSKTQAQSKGPPEQTVGRTDQKPMDIAVKIHSVRAAGNVLANASVDLNGVFAIRGVRIMKGKEGPFVSMPSYKIGDEYRDVCFPCTKEFREVFQQTVLRAYQQELGQLVQQHQDQAQEMSGPTMQQM